METEKPVSDDERERDKPMPNKLHSLIQKHFVVAFHAFAPLIVPPTGPVFPFCCKTET
jgi:hypothetical protein